MASLGKMTVSMDERDRELLDKLATAISELATELHTYNHPPVQYTHENTKPYKTQGDL